MDRLKDLVVEIKRGKKVVGCYKLPDPRVAFCQEFNRFNKGKLEAHPISKAMVRASSRRRVE